MCQVEENSVKVSTVLKNVLWKRESTALILLLPVKGMKNCENFRYMGKFYRYASTLCVVCVRDTSFV